MSLLATFALNNNATEEVAARSIIKPTVSLNPKDYFEELFNLPDSFLKDFVNVANLKPPVKLATPTKVRTPPSSEVKRHWFHGTYSYCMLSKAIDFKCKINCPDYKVTKTFEDVLLGTFAIAGHDPVTKEIIVSHRGTSNLRNWLRDFSYGKVNMTGAPEGILLHEGFWGVYQSNAKNLNEYLMTMLDNPQFKGYKVVFTGHSLGAAVATIHAVDMAPKIKAKGYPIELYAYHGPRAGNQAFVDYAISQDITVARYTNRGDIVSHVAPRQFDYTHIPGEFHSDFSDLLGLTFHECTQEYDEDPKCGWKEIKNICLLDHIGGFGKLVNFAC
ncbi:alpha/beta-hydrolase [Conidiobolus coronatus NRRL 28638]|uniref:Alpha/beta-hydrolase n=1 Tax=Conidiobolus coronatus (strain ATCC 28846 / CBS 209.66 / NRRL 28638) TaxID=796925 RepID=A0A137NSU2_CONC2|nr:alpha/beta-hydrolase [Conidiobolus coronatus NRRL 28638]|eukprot:KXN65853.1 alpha/beta-hydrolase [Conidiobolus coronatus NRRL 28638]